MARKVEVKGKGKRKRSKRQCVRFGSARWPGGDVRRGGWRYRAAKKTSGVAGLSRSEKKGTEEKKECGKEVVEG
jgi:hypothetical protein